MKYKLFISDYDGTLGHAPQNDIDKETLSAINKFIDKGGKFVVCSGRETTSISRILKNSGLKGLVASFQGARITDIESGEKILDGGLDLEVALDILNKVKGKELTAIAYGDNEIFIQEENMHTGFYKDAVQVKSSVVDVEQYLKTTKQKSPKICWVGEDNLVNETADILNEIYKGDGVKFNSGAKALLEAINPAYSKGETVKFLSNYYSIPYEEIITVGDSTNDIDLLVGPWHGVAVGDGKERLKEVADEITVPFKDKPVKTLLEKYCLD